MKKFESIKALQSWFFEKPHSWSCILSSRMALRVLPHSHFLIPVSDNRSIKQSDKINLLLPILHCHLLCAIAATLKDENHISEIANSAKMASQDIRKAKSAPFYNVLENAVHVVFSKNPADASHHASQAYMHASAAGNEAAQTALMADIKILEESASDTCERELLLSPLWPNWAIPDWEKKDWTIFAKKMWQIRNDWHIWAQWYGGGERNGVKFPGVLHGAKNDQYIFGLSADKALKLWMDIASIHHTRWDVAAWKINGEIREMIEGSLTVIPEAEAESVLASATKTVLSSPEPGHSTQYSSQENNTETGAPPAYIDHGASDIPHDLATLIIRQKIVISAILPSLHSEISASLKSGLNEYNNELNVRGEAAIYGVINDLGSIIQVGVQSSKQDGLLEPATLEAFARFEANHAVMLRLLMGKDQ